MFNNPTVQSTIKELNGNKLGVLKGFGMYSSSGTVYYYLMNMRDNKVYILNDEWKFISFKDFNSPINMITIGNSLYMTGDLNVWKVDKDLNILINYESNNLYAKYYGISYNPLNRLIYVAASNLLDIQVFDLDLALIRSLNTSPHIPHSITVSSNQLYVGTGGGIIIVYGIYKKNEDEKIINKFNGCDGNFDKVTSITFDQNGYMATCCLRKLYLFSPNGSYTGKSITTLDYPQCICFDSKDRFIQLSYEQITIYN